MSSYRLRQEFRRHYCCRLGQGGGVGIGSGSDGGTGSNIQIAPATGKSIAVWEGDDEISATLKRTVVAPATFTYNSITSYYFKTGAPTGSGSDSGSDSSSASGLGSADVKTEEEEEHRTVIVQTPSVLSADKVQVLVQDGNGKYTGQRIGLKALNPYGNAKKNHQIFADTWLLTAGTLKGSSVNGQKVKTVKGNKAKAELLWTYDIYPPDCATAAWRSTPKTVLIKDSGAKAGDIIYVEFYNAAKKTHSMLPATVDADGSVTCVLPFIGDVSTLSVVRIN